jgi:hypothetical protein
MSEIFLLRNANNLSGVRKSSPEPYEQRKVATLSDTIFAHAI